MFLNVQFEIKSQLLQSFFLNMPNSGISRMATRQNTPEQWMLKAILMSDYVSKGCQSYFLAVRCPSLSIHVIERMYTLTKRSHSLLHSSMTYQCCHLTLTHNLCRCKKDRMCKAVKTSFNTYTLKYFHHRWCQNNLIGCRFMYLLQIYPQTYPQAT